MSTDIGEKPPKLKLSRRAKVRRQKMVAAGARLAVRVGGHPPTPDPTRDAAGQTGARVFGPRPGHYGLGMGIAMDDFTDQARRAAGDGW